MALQGSHHEAALGETSCVLLVSGDVDEGRETVDERLNGCAERLWYRVEVGPGPSFSRTLSDPARSLDPILECRSGFNPVVTLNQAAQVHPAGLTRAQLRITAKDRVSARKKKGNRLPAATVAVKSMSRELLPTFGLSQRGGASETKVGRGVRRASERP